MKKLILVSTLLLASSSVFAAQANEPKGGFVGPSNVSVKTVAVALEAKDDTQVLLTGYIIAGLGDEEYKFSDDTGEIIIEIDDRDWNGVQATPETKIVIQGEVDSGWSYTTIDVDSVELAKQGCSDLHHCKRFIDQFESANVLLTSSIISKWRSSIAAPLLTLNQLFE